MTRELGKIRIRVEILEKSLGIMKWHHEMKSLKTTHQTRRRDDELLRRLGI